MSETKNYFIELNNINVNDKVEKKNGLSYLSWAYAWGEVKKLYPDANYVIYERQTEFGPVNYFTDGMTCWVKTGVTVNGIEHIEELPVMDYKNRSIYVNDITSFDVNKTIQRSLTKALARHGMGLYIYAGEDLPDSEAEAKQRAAEAKTPAKKAASSKSENVAADPAKPTLKELITNIGNLIKSGAVEMATYKAMVKEISGVDTFMVNKATEDDYNIVLSIYNKMLGK